MDRDLVAAGVFLPRCVLPTFPPIIDMMLISLVLQKAAPAEAMAIGSKGSVFNDHSISFNLQLFWFVASSLHLLHGFLGDLLSLWIKEVCCPLPPQYLLSSDQNYWTHSGECSGSMFEAEGIHQAFHHFPMNLLTHHPTMSYKARVASTLLSLFWASTLFNDLVPAACLFKLQAYPFITFNIDNFFILDELCHFSQLVLLVISFFSHKNFLHLAGSCWCFLLHPDLGLDIPLCQIFYMWLFFKECFMCIRPRGLTGCAMWGHYL